MEDQCDSVVNIEEQSFEIPRSDSKVIGKKRSGMGLEEKCQLAQKQVKMRDLHSLLASKEIPSSSKNKEAKVDVSKEEVSQVTEEPVTMHMDASQAEKIEGDTSSLNFNTHVANNPAFDENSRCAENLAFLRKHDREGDKSYVVSRGIGLDLNAEDVSSSANHDSFHPYTDHIQLKSTEDSECGSTTGPMEENDSLRIWMEMKQNGFISSSHAVLPMLKQRGRKAKTHALKKKIELAKKEQVDRFTKIAAPSGLLNDLNPGIINHVRNRKQVHSIIEALVKSEKEEHGQSGSKQNRNRKDIENLYNTGIHQLSFPHEVGALNTLSWSWQTRGPPMSMNKPFSLILEEKDGNGGSRTVEKLCGRPGASNSIPFSENDSLSLKLSSSTTKGFENASSLSNDESTNNSSVSSLSVNAATVASQWLELLLHDIKGRLTALRRSKRRVQDVITTELPLLLSKEFQCNEESGPYVMRKFADGVSNVEKADMHRTRWTALFDQMDNSLAEEEKQLESWLNQVQEMQMHCERGLQNFPCNAAYGLQQLGRLENDFGSVKMDASERELAVQAAAASIYSTCNFLSSKEDVSCC